MTAIDTRLRSISPSPHLEEGETDPSARILVCEDEIFIALAEVDLLERNGYDVVGTAATCNGAVENCEQHSPDLVLMDITLRGCGDGVDAAVEIRRRFQIPCVFVTAHQSDMVARRAHAIEPAGYVNKPYDDGELLDAVRNALTD